jgi:hydrophobic/amphiphilic exporter-1 (mainly G- bacteria), HAE1 family
MQLPEAASLERTGDAAAKLEKAVMNVPGVEGITSVLGFSLLSQTQSTYNSFYFVTLKDWEKRTKPEEQYTAIQRNLTRALSGIKEGTAFSFDPPSIPGVGTSGGVTMMLEDRSGSGAPSLLTKNLYKFIAAGSKRPEILAIVPTYLPDVPQLYVHVDRGKVQQQQARLAGGTRLGI